MGADDLLVGPRLKREACKRTKHDSDFSKWQVLIGPTDWEDYSVGKEGVARYRVHNLPSILSPGLYELGIVASRSGLGRETGKLDPDGIVAVYLGQADNVRVRLQPYGRSGAHLGSLHKGPGLFEEIFSRGYSIGFRWAPMKTKRDAEETEARLLYTFDYAWNKGGNGARRPDDILQKISEIASSTSKSSNIYRKLLPYIQKQVGIKIEGSKSLSLENKSGAYADEENNNFLSGIFKFSRSRPRLVSDNSGTNEDFIPICRVILNDGIPCRRPPLPGRKRCEEHKEMRIYGFSSKSTTEGQSHYVHDVYPDSGICNDQKYHTACGVNLGDGTFCGRQPVVGRKRCEEHKELRVNGIVSKSATGDKSQVPTISLGVGTSNHQMHNDTSSSVSRDFTTICGATLGNGSFCKMQPVVGRKRCEEHKGLRVNGIASKSATGDKSQVPTISLGVGTSNHQMHNDTSSSVSRDFTTICGATLGNGSFCKRQPVEGNKRCWQHKGKRVDFSWSKIDSSVSGFDTQMSFVTCGVTLHNGSVCMRAPVHGRKRCEQHKGMRVTTY